DKIVYDKVGIYNYVIHESSEAGSGWTNADDVEATVEVGYAENGRDLVVKSIKYNNRQTDAATFNNTYEATGSVTLSVAKQVNGKSPLANEKFQFQLAGQDGAPMPAEGTTCETVGSAPAQFGSIPFALADAGKTYIYTITETTQGSSEWKTAGPVTATVTVGKDNGDGTLSAPTVTYSVSGMNGGAALFNNTYETSTQATVNVHKTVTGGTDKVKNESFDFELHKADEQGNMTDEVVGTVSAKADETKSFNPIKYTTSDAGKTFTYWIHEKGHNDKGWTADKDTKVTVKVVENPDRSLSAEVSYERGTSAAEFTNAYATSGQATLSVFKTVNGGTEQGAGQKFHFDLYKADDQGNAQGEKVDSVETAVGEKASFGAIDLSGEGTYHYVIKESGYNNGAWFAAGDVIATVTATDNGDGTLKTEVAYSNPDADKSAALFDNVYAPTNASIWVKKTVNGEAAPVDKHFTFELQAQDGAPMPGEATADTFGGDTCSFGDIEFTEEGEYRYVIHETADLGEGWTNAADVPVTVKVVRDEDAKMLKVESISYGDSVFEENGQAMALFDNKYEAPEKPDQPNGETPKADTPNSEGGQPAASDGAKSSGTKTGDSMILAGGALALVAVAAAGIAAFALRRRK
ncbi:MAG: FctA domain-containing protein, partial [Eggerthellaceae bacterium]|nr:FctA domain-containing protein [Eggerthellaceae bacterium]